MTNGFEEIRLREEGNGEDEREWKDWEWKDVEGKIYSKVRENLFLAVGMYVFEGQMLWIIFKRFTLQKFMNIVFLTYRNEKLKWILFQEYFEHYIYLLENKNLLDNLLPQFLRCIYNILKLKQVNFI